GDDQGVFELGGPLVVLGHNGPPVLPQVVVDGAQGDHRFDGEGHPRFHHGGGAGVVVVGDDQTGVELRTHTVAGEVADHAVTETFGVGLDDTADHIDPASGAARLDAAHHGFLRAFDQEAVLLGDVPGQEGGVGVTMHTVLVGGDVD